MTVAPLDNTTVGQRGIYFYLSYAHPAPASEGGTGDVDAGVAVLCRDLNDTIARVAGPHRTLDPGFYDGLIPRAADVKTAIKGALSRAVVFIPLYSPAYFNRTWPRREREAFRHRILTVRDDDASGHLVPVLWIPVLPKPDDPEIDAARAFGAGVPEYAENGLRALCMLRVYQDPYSRILNRLAEHIVQVARRSPLDPSPAPALDDVSVPQPTGTPFVIAVAARIGSGPHDRSRPSGNQWRPFGDALAVPIARYIANVAERLGLPTRIVDAHQERYELDRGPGMVLVDPQILDQDGGPAALSAVSHRLPAWVTVVVVAGRPGDASGARADALAREATDMLARAGAPRLKTVGTLEEFVDVVPILVTDARRQFLNATAVPKQRDRSARRSRLRDHPPRQKEQP